MPHSKIRNSSMVDLMARMPVVNKGSLLTSIENLLKTIETSESAVMIPTLLRDKCEFDAWELLFVAKILKASILGHTDLVEFYMNHIKQQKNNLVGAASAASSPAGALPGGCTSRQAPASPALSPASTASINHNGLTSTNGQPAENGGPLTSSPASSISSQMSSASSSCTATATTGPLSSSSSTGWTTATSEQQTNNRQQPQQPQQNNNSNRSAWSSISSSSGISSTQTSTIIISSNNNNNNNSQEPDVELAALAKTLLTPATLPPAIVSRQPQPPSLLQLTTTNNHINSRATLDILTNAAAVEQLAGSTNGTTITTTNTTTSTNTNGFELDPHPTENLSISTLASNQQLHHPSTPTTPTSAAAATATIQHHEPLRSSRSAGCLFRNQSGASSPRTPAGTPTTPHPPQAETLAVGLTQLPGDPSMPVKLLLQIEHLKSSIVYVTNLLENVVELYKKSIDNMAA